MDSSKTPSSKASKGTVGIQARDGRLQFNLPRELFGDKQVRKMSGYPDTKDGWKFAQAKVAVMNEDILKERFDLTLEKYGLGKKAKHLSAVANTVIEPQKVLMLPELWNMYCEYRKTNLAETTYKLRYRGEMLNTIKALPTIDLNNPSSAINWILNNRKPQSAKRILELLSACCEWAIKCNLTGKNPFYGTSSKVNTKTSNNEKVNNDSWDENSFKDIRAFTIAERDAIIAEFGRTKHTQHRVPYVKFLFYTGCRPGEAAGLRWGDIKPDCSAIHFRRSYDCRVKIFKNTKTATSRILPCTNTLKELLLSIKPENFNNNDLVFTSKRGLPVDQQDFFIVWSGNKSNNNPGLIRRLVEQGKVRAYLKPYATRHTFVTLQKNAGNNAETIADWVGNSPAVIWKHYFDSKANEIIPIDI